MEQVSRCFKSHLQKRDILIVAVLSFSKFKVIEMVACNLVKQLNKLVSY